MEEKVLVIGGLGFIGFHLVHALESRNYQVTVSTRSLGNKEGSAVSPIQIDLETMSDEELAPLLGPFQIVVFCGGLDDRNIPTGDAWQYFYKGNVTPCVRLAKLCSEGKLQHLVILGSYFSHFNRKHPEWKMQERHPYVYSRRRQELETREALGGKAFLTVLEIPYVFGSAPGMIPLWKPLIDYIYRMPVVFYTKGGTNICSVEQVARAIVGILESPIRRDNWIVGGKNVSWKELIKMMVRPMKKRKLVITVPNILVYFSTIILKLLFKIKGKQSGLDAYHFVSVQTKNTFLDTRESMAMLGYRHVDLQAAIARTVEACGRAAH